MKKEQAKWEHTTFCANCVYWQRIFQNSFTTEACAKNQSLAQEAARCPFYQSVNQR